MWRVKKQDTRASTISRIPVGIETQFKRRHLFIALYLLFALIFFGVGSFTCVAQANKACETPSKKGDKAYQKARELLKDDNLREAVKILEELLEEEPEYIKGIFLLAEVKRFQESYNAATQYYKKVLELCPDYRPDIYYEIAHMAYQVAKYDTAVRYFDLFLTQPKKDARKEKFSDSLVKRAEFLERIYKNPVPFNPEPLTGVCTEADEYLPILSPDNEMLFFTRRYKKKTRDKAWGEVEIEEFCMSRAEDRQFPKGDKLPSPFNTGNNEGGATLSIDNKLMFFTGCNRDDGLGGCDIYLTENGEFGWSMIKNMGKDINSQYWDSQVSLSSDDKTLYFASDRDSLNGMDIFKIEKDSLGNWGNPINLGSPINTPGNEKSPFIHLDNNTLYYTSTGHQGLGGYDIFISRKDSNGNWGMPQNIGYPINSEEDDLGFYVSLNGKKGFFASNNLKGVGGWDIYGFPLYEEARPYKVLFLRGEVKDKEGNVVRDPKIELKDLSTQKVTYIPVDTITGQYVHVQALKNDYSLTIQKEGYFYYSEYISKEDSVYEQPKTLNVGLEQLKVGASYIVQNILFATDSYELQEASRFELDNFVEFLQNNPRLRVAINGHTDNIGEDEKNLVLSKNRARAVYDYVLSKGITPGRLTHQGFGEHKPIVDNNTEEGRRLNRRTEVIILEK